MHTKIITWSVVAERHKHDDALHVVAPKKVTKETKYPKTWALVLRTFKYTRAQNAVHKPRAAYGTPRRFTRLKTAGALPSAASA